MKYSVLALDLDGTLTDSNKKIPEKNKQAIISACRKGIKIVLASGRPVFGIEKLADELELNINGGYVLAFNGGQIIDWKTKEIIYERMLADECKHDICEISRKYEVWPLTYYKKQIVAENDDDEYMIKETKCNDTTIKKVDNLEAFVDYKVPKYLVVGDHEKLLKVQAELLKIHGDKIDAFFSESYFLEIVPIGVEKSGGLEILLDKIGHTKEELMAFGDGMNDISMLKYAGFAVVMENAYEKVKEYADYITLSNDESGVAYAIDKFCL